MRKFSCPLIAEKLNVTLFSVDFLHFISVFTLPWQKCQIEKPL